MSVNSQLVKAVAHRQIVDVRFAVQVVEHSDATQTVVLRLPSGDEVRLPIADIASVEPTGQAAQR